MIIRSICDVRGVDASEYSSGWRHVRDIWQLALSEEDSFQFGELVVGSLLITRRRYTLNGAHVVFPGHIGVITGIGTTPSFIHASPTIGRVEERPLRTLSTVLGCVEVGLE